MKNLFFKSSMKKDRSGHNFNAPTITQKLNPALPSFSKKLHDNTGQHTLEYVLMLIVVMAGLMVGGPYVIRSWNAQVKGWEDSVRDSINDPLLEAPPPGQPPGTCVCTALAPVNCGLSARVPPSTDPSGFVECEPTEMFYMKTCTPWGCEWAFNMGIMANCQTDEECCTEWRNVGCGPNGVPPCPDGQMRQERTCGPGDIESQCVPDPFCEFTCIGELPDPPTHGRCFVLAMKTT